MDAYNLDVFLLELLGEVGWGLLGKWEGGEEWDCVKFRIWVWAEN